MFLLSENVYEWPTLKLIVLSSILPPEKLSRMFQSDFKSSIL